MNNQGWVRTQRTLLDETMTGRLSSHEALAFVWLCLLADKDTGIGHVNAAVLRHWLPDLSSDAAKRALKGLDDKGYISRSITPQSRLAYPYIVSGYQLHSEGSVVRLTPTPDRYFESRVCKAFDVKDAPEGALETALESTPETAPEGAHYYKKEKKKENKKEKEKVSITDKELLVPNNPEPPVELSVEVPLTTLVETSVESSIPGRVDTSVREQRSQEQTQEEQRELRAEPAPSHSAPPPPANVPILSARELAFKNSLFACELSQDDDGTIRSLITGKTVSVERVNHQLRAYETQKREYAKAAQAQAA